MRRYLDEFVTKDLDRKIVLVGGPRQVGKTTLARSLPFARVSYLNFDAGEDRDIIRRQTWSRASDLVIFDELHKMKSWKTWLKGIYDTQGIPPRLLVTGSARLDVVRRAGDSLAGRHFHYRLHPLSVAEVRQDLAPDEALERLLRLGGFPEPFLLDSEQEAARWRRSHLDRILREDLLDLEQVRSVKEIDQLVELLSRRVGSPVSFDSLARDLAVSPHTIKRWMLILESLFIIFLITPYTKRVTRGLRKQPKVYFFDTGAVRGDEGMRLENTVATALLKYCHFLEDTRGERWSLHFVRDREKREVDFCLVQEDIVSRLVEVKMSEIDTKALRHFSTLLEPRHGTFLIVKNLPRNLTIDTIEVRRASDWLSELEA